ncbi:DNA cytosine methyltransferase [Brenneria rubrifaciens]|uniref:DNA cytosine methyltransferase n=1 Tax=Brenneria rubrifaciens TaxID=55213 RepID=A0A4P8QTR4_9GAMM|nr:DNA cytosine methyltransferase [Brenneria rubrifaciens]QCR10036.1 DNA cytosine methyltransferase [Brenneria rubrifaciens]
MTAYYNEIDPFAAQWLRNLIAAGHIAPGDVDERSIEDVTPDDLRNYTQCHFFAGIGVWSYALRRAGWPDDKPVWTGSCPCQPFSAAGKKGGFADERHLWPAFYHLINQYRPTVVFGEQVASKDGLAWLDVVQTDMEASFYAVAAVDLCAASVGAPHIRQRLFWVADYNSEQWNRGGNKRQDGRHESANGGAVSGVEYTDSNRSQRRVFGGANEKRKVEHGSVGCDGTTGGMAYPAIGQQRQIGSARPRTEHERSAREKVSAALTGFRGDSGALQVNGFWRDADWLFCRDGKWRPVEPGTFPLAHGITNRVGRLRAYGNAINAEAAKEFITAFLDVRRGN